MALLHIFPAAFLATALAIVGGTLDSSRDDAPTGAELAFADAPHGVDPMVTGPVSARFKEHQKIAGCDAAKWPDVPLACYPD